MAVLVCSRSRFPRTMTRGASAGKVSICCHIDVNGLHLLERSSTPHRCRSRRGTAFARDIAMRSIDDRVRGDGCCDRLRARRRAGLPFLRRRHRGGDRRQGPRSSLGARVPARRPHAGDRAARAHAHRRQGRQALARARRRAEGLRVGPGRPARRRRSTAAMRRTTRSISATPSRWTQARARACARTAGGRRHAPARRRRGDLPPGRAALAAAIISAAASCRRPTTISSRRSAIISPRATRRRTSATISARSSASGRTARCRRTIHSSARPAPSRRSGATATAMPQGLAFNPADGKLWEHEHGPRGGDEINIVEKGKNYGWPVIGYGIDYNGAKIHESTHKDGMEQPLKYWVPSIAPSGHGVLHRRACCRPGAATCSSARWPASLLVRLEARRRQGGQGGAPAAGCCANAFAMCATGRTARSGSPPTAPRVGFCASRRRNDASPRSTRRPGP